MIEIIAASIYQNIYLFIVTILTLIAAHRYSTAEAGARIEKSKYEIGNLSFVVFMILFIGLRPVSGRYFVDMANYVENYKAFYEGVKFTFDSDAENFIFDNLFSWWGSKRLGTTSFFLLISAIYFGAAYLGIRRLFPQHKFVAYLVFLGAFSTFSYGTNGIKAGAAASLFILALGYRDKLKLCIPLVFLSWGFHHSMQLPIAAFVLTFVFKNPKWYFFGWTLCFLCALTHITWFQELFAGFSDEQGASYLFSTGEDWGGKTGFRIDFVIYSAMPVIAGYYSIFVENINTALYQRLLNLYLCTNGVWMLCMYANFTNRIAYLSWFLYPIVLIYPFVNERFGKNRNKTLTKVMLVHLGFTLFMTFIYYA